MRAGNEIASQRPGLSLPDSLVDVLLLVMNPVNVVVPSYSSRDTNTAPVSSTSH